MIHRSQAAADNGSGVSRRRLLGVATMGVAGLAACAGGAGSDPVAPGGEVAPPSGQADEELARTSEIPAGGGMIFEGPRVVVTQPAPGEFKGFSAVCTHQGCIVASVADGTINCPCHGSRFSVVDGSVTAGPASRPLPAVPVTIDGDRIIRAG